MIVSPREYEGTEWLPGSLPDVLGVELDEECPRDAIRIATDRGDPGAGEIVLLASGYPRPIPGVPPERNLNGISFAVANATGMVARIIEGTTGVGLDPAAPIRDLLSRR
jgi:hypothetical protein